jgi:hypothetical protein
MLPFRPYPADQLDYYYRGFVTAYLGDSRHSASPESVPEEKTEAYDDGLRDGEGAATLGYPVGQICIDLNIPHNPIGEAFEVFDLGVETYGVAHSLIAGVFGAAFFEAGVLALMASIAATTRYQWPDESLPAGDIGAFATFLAELSDPVSIELFIGGGVDLNAKGCELRLTPVFKSAAEARAAVASMGRSQAVVGCVRTDMSRGFRLVDEGE